MATQKDNVECFPINFQLTVKNTVEPSSPTSFTVQATDIQSLLDALVAFGENNSNFSVETADIQSGRQYVVAVTVNGQTVRARANQFWETLLYEDQDIKPICLSCYQLQNNDHVYLRFSPF